jgi:hypothetical protein
MILCRNTFYAGILALFIHILFFYILFIYKHNENKLLKKHENVISFKVISPKKEIIQKKLISKQIQTSATLRKNIGPVIPILQTNNNSLKSFMPTAEQINQWRKEGENSNTNESAFLGSFSKFEKNYPKMLALSEFLNNQFDIPSSLRKTFSNAEVKIKLIKNLRNNWTIVSAYGKNSYFRSFIYEVIKKSLADSQKTKIFSNLNTEVIYITWNYFKIKSTDEINLDKRYQVASNTLSFSLIDKVKPDEYKLISGNILGAIDYLADKVLPDDYQEDDEIIALKKSYAFNHEGLMQN